MSCSLALFSVIPRRSLARRSGFGGDWEARAVDLYYERAYTRRIEIGVFAEDTISLASFVVDSLNSASSISRELQLSASNEELISVITRSEKAVPTLISMLDWTFKPDKDIRLFAAKATADLASYLRIAGNVGAVRLVSSLLDAENDQPPCENDEGNNDDASLGPPKPADGNSEIGGCTGNEQGRNCYQRWCSWISKRWQFSRDGRGSGSWRRCALDLDDPRGANLVRSYSTTANATEVGRRLALGVVGDPDDEDWR
ncbi:hypothetical protein HU200_051090 [Digitaria exilis]|uniref:Uncharacterized protein n=1 Tax=Digitaria exilis TaxID=1010633 RepID=A0A835AQL3_9POAL|nr:hypothetical protein HU200_051090 [Digitaria exilis]